MPDLPPLGPSNVIVTPASSWPALWKAYASIIHPSDTWEPEDWTKPLALKDIKSVHHFAAQSAVGKGRMIALPCADQLTREAGNALLKLLEEPPAGVTLILFGETDRMLATIRSRVHILHIPSEAVSSQRFIQFYKELDPLRNPSKARTFLYYAPLLHNSIQTDLIFDAFSQS